MFYPTATIESSSSTISMQNGCISNRFWTVSLSGLNYVLSVDILVMGLLMLILMCASFCCTEVIAQDEVIRTIAHP